MAVNLVSFIQDAFNAFKTWTLVLHVGAPVPSAVKQPQTWWSHHFASPVKYGGQDGATIPVLPPHVTMVKQFHFSFIRLQNMLQKNKGYYLCMRLQTPACLFWVSFGVMASSLLNGLSADIRTGRVSLWIATQSRHLQSVPPRVVWLLFRGQSAHFWTKAYPFLGHKTCA